MIPDPVAVERTRLAWRRTSLAATIVALLAVGVLVRVRSLPALVVAIGMLIAWATLLTVAQHRIITLDRSVLSPPTQHPALPRATRTPLRLGLLTVALAVLALSLVLA